MKKTVTFLPDNIVIEVDNGENLLSAAAKAGVFIQASCGGDGVCGKCKIKVEQGEVAANKAMQLKGDEHAAGFRLACQSSVIEDLVVFVPAATSKD
ncbi:MAG: 2Fe-2S iron-sulfur cluster binding domain-containing protein, partial [Proteobacteria bacterium]|nr:2Fe-2S iron-sulfur cluster binding domain-containing protein [Pseudomonadota bacterium]